MFWFGFHYIFFLCSDKKHRAQEVGIRLSTGLVAAFIGPMLGGVLIDTAGFFSVFLIAAISLFVAVFFLFLSPEVKTPYHFTWKCIFNRHSTKLALFYASRGMIDSATKVVWPLFIFFILESYTSLGVTQSLVAVGSIILIYLSGKWEDKHSKRTVVRVISFLESANWIFRSFIQTVSQVFGATIFGAVTIGALSPALTALEYDVGVKKKDIAGYFVHREFFLSMGRVAMLLAIFFIPNLKIAVLFAAFLQFFVFFL
jgi:MFS family permease